jgi:general stress protein 26
MNLGEVKERSTALGMWAYMATVGADSKPDVVPVHPCWIGDEVWVMIGKDSVKARNIAANPNVAMHWTASAEGDGVEVWGTAEVVTDVAEKVRVWTLFDYDLNAFAPGGPEESPDSAFAKITPERALWLAMYGMKGSDRWTAGS